MTEVTPPSEQFEKSLLQLQSIVKKLEEGDLSLEQSMTEFEQGVKLTNACEIMLKDAELKVKKLTEDNSIKLNDYDEQDKESEN